ncbi:MAG: hypothetical protein R2827_15940 [Bdellovibrionales bacterium]
MEDYGKALGILQNLQSMYYKAFNQPENHLIALNIFRKLCWIDEFKNYTQLVEKEYKAKEEILYEANNPLELTEILKTALFYEPLMSKAECLRLSYLMNSASLK